MNGYDTKMIQTALIVVPTEVSHEQDLDCGR